MLTEPCDNYRCSSQSLVAFAKDIGGQTMTLQFCGHHGNNNYVELIRSDWMVLIDERVFRIENPRGKGEAARPESEPEGSEVLEEGSPDDPISGVPAVS